MSVARPQVSVFNSTGEASSTVELPAIFSTVVRADQVNFVHTNMAKNARQAYAVSSKSGYQTSAESWGTGRAVARIPRVAGGGTHRSGQAAFGNMCRGGGMYSPTKTYRRWHRHINTTQKQHAVASALAASAVSDLVMGRGHKISAVQEIPIVVEDSAFANTSKTKAAVELLKVLGCGEELARCKDGRARNSGRAALRGRVHRVPRGPLIIYTGCKDQLLAFRNIPGVEGCEASALNLLQLAPGGTLGRLCVFTKSAMELIKHRYPDVPHSMMTSSDLQRIINSDEIQSVLKVKKVGTKPKHTGATNGIRNKSVIAKLALKKL